MVIYLLLKAPAATKILCLREGELVFASTSAHEAFEALKELAIVHLPDMIMPGRTYTSKNGDSLYWLSRFSTYWYDLKDLYCYLKKRK